MGDKVYTELDVKGLKNLLEVVDNGNANDCKAIILKFGASWCGPCKRMSPVMDTLSRSYPNVLFFKVDVDEQPELAQQFKVSTMPTFVFIINKQVVHTFSGAKAELLKASVKELYTQILQIAPNRNINLEPEVDERDEKWCKN